MVVVPRQTRQRAEMAFLEQEVFRTRDRTGILLFLSLRATAFFRILLPGTCRVD